MTASCAADSSKRPSFSPGVTAGGALWLCRPSDAMAVTAPPSFSGSASRPLTLFRPAARGIRGSRVGPGSGRGGCSDGMPLPAQFIREDGDITAPLVARQRQDLLFTPVIVIRKVV